MVGAAYRDGKILKAALIPSPNVCLGDVVASRQNAIPNSGEIDLNTVRSDVNQYDFEAVASGVEHHLQIVLASQRSFHREALGISQVLFCRLEDMASGCNGEHPGRRGLESIRDGIRVEKGDFLEEIRVPAGQRCFTRAVGSGNHGECGANHRAGCADFFWRSARISCKRFFSMATPARAF